MRSLAALALVFSALAVQAETAPPSAAEIAQSKASCAAEVQQDCLFLLATDAALADPETAELLLNDIAYSQATAGDTAGAERTLSLTRPGFLALTALGRDAEAAIAFDAFVERIGATKGKADPPKPGEVELEKIEKLVKAGQIDSALSTAFAIPEKGRFEQSKGLRLIVDYHIEQKDFAAAEMVARQIAPIDPMSASLSFAMAGRAVDPRADALVAVIKARSASGDLEGAARVTNGMIGPQTRILARIALAEAYFKAGAQDDGKAQLDLILSDMSAVELTHLFGLAELSQSADLAFRYGEPEIARQHTDFAYKAYSRPTVRRGGENAAPKPSPVAYLHLATVMQLVGQTGKGKALYAQAVSPLRESALSSLPSDHMAAVLVSQIRLGDPEVQDTITALLAKDDPFWMSGLRILQQAATTLVELGYLDEALAIADQLEPRLRNDTFRLDGDDPAVLYSAILAQDPDLAPQVLTDKLAAETRFKVSLALTRSMVGHAQIDAARSLLQVLADDPKARIGEDDKLVCALRSIAETQETLGFSEDAAQTRQRGFALANDAASPEVRTFQLLVLAASFPDAEAGSLTSGLGCIGYSE